jgi:hypothetical protein
MSGRDVGAHERVPLHLTRTRYDRLMHSLSWSTVREEPRLPSCDWVSVDLDYLLPAAQFKCARPMLDDPIFRNLLARAHTRVFCVSPQFTNGGDRYADWVIHGKRSRMQRAVNALRALPCTL